MSIFVDVTASCAACGTKKEVALAASVNADRRPDLRAEIIEGVFQATDCPNCGARMRLPAHLTYIDMARGQWILVETGADIVRWGEVEANADLLYATAFGDKASPLARRMGKDLKPRLVFGWPALREKLVAGEAGLDDVTLELAKIAIMRAVPAPPVGDLIELRLARVQGEELVFWWFDGATEAALSEARVERAVYDAIAADPGPWEPLRQEVAAGLFTDMKRLFTGAGKAAA